jgi:hypothetical protein
LVFVAYEVDYRDGVLKAGLPNEGGASEDTRR